MREGRYLVDRAPFLHHSRQSLIYGDAKSKPPARIERWALRLTPFDFEIVHRPGVSNIANYYSRSPGGAGVSAYLDEIKSEQHDRTGSHTTRNDHTRDCRGNAHGSGAKRVTPGDHHGQAPK